MPRGVYDRSKLKKTATAPVAKTEIVRNQKKGKVKTELKAAESTESAAVPKLVKAAINVPVPVMNKLLESQYGFQILGANLATLSSSLEPLRDNPILQGAISKEIHETVKTMTALRLEVFGTQDAPTPVNEPVVEEEEEIVAPPATASVTIQAAPGLPQPTAVAAPVLPQGNAQPPSFQPPAPPVLTNH